MSRHRLHTNKLEDFAKYCESVGWAREKPKGDYEVLRMTRVGSQPLIVHTKLSTSAGNSPVHLTVHGVGETMFTQYVRNRQPVSP